MDAWPCSNTWGWWESETVRKCGCNMKEELENIKITLGNTTRETAEVMAVH